MDVERKNTDSIANNRENTGDTKLFLKICYM